MKEIIDQLGSLSEVAEATGQNRKTVWAWKARGSVPPRHWPGLIRLARAKGVELSTDQLIEMAHQARN